MLIFESINVFLKGLFSISNLLFIRMKNNYLVINLVIKKKENLEMNEKTLYI